MQGWLRPGVVRGFSGPGRLVMVLKIIQTGDWWKGRGSIAGGPDRVKKTQIMGVGECACLCSGLEHRPCRVNFWKEE